MFKLYFLLLAICFTPATNITTTVKLGNAIVQIQTSVFGEQSSKLCFINLHANETTSIEACQQFLANSNGKFIYVAHKPQRNIEFELNNTKHVFDPNRIFTNKGIQATLKKLSVYNNEAKKEVEGFANAIIQQIGDAKMIIAMHNNGNKGLSIKSYLKGGAEYANAANVYINALMDEDDFVYTTDKKVFNHLKENKINVILQKSSGAVDDGSLSIYYGNKKIPYINIEAEQGHLKEQVQVLQILEPLFKEY